MGSRRLKCVSNVADSCLCGGGFHQKTMTTMVNAPIGRLM